MKTATVLVADDSRLICTSLANQLRAAGFHKDNIALSYKSTDVLNKCRHTHYDLIICDYNFNGYLNGYQLLEELRHHQYLQPKTLFVFLTGENDQKVVRTIIDTQPDDYILNRLTNPFCLSASSRASSAKGNCCRCIKHSNAVTIKRQLMNVTT
ncbi:response regulator [Vibrio olivae]